MKKTPDAYPLPENPNPGEFWRFCVYVPKDLDHLLAFWGSLGYLAKWVAWERENAPPGSLSAAAAAWKEANELTRASFNAGDCAESEDTDVPFDMRVHPSKPWITQVSTNGGVSWHDAIVQPNWNLYSYSSNPTAGEDPGDIAAALYRNWYIYITNKMLDDINADVPKADTINAIMTELGGYNGNPETKAALEQAYDELEALDTAVQDQLTEEECIWFENWEDARSEIAERGDSWLDSFSEWITGIVNDAADGLSSALNTAGASLGLKLADFIFDKGWESGGGGGAGFGSGTCAGYLILEQQSSGTLMPDESSEVKCHYFQWEVPEDYRLVAVRFDYTVSPVSNLSNGLQANNGPSWPDPNCDTIVGASYVWTATSYAFPIEFNVVGFRMGVTSAIWEAVGWGDVLEDGEEVVDSTVVTGPATAVTPVLVEAHGDMIGVETGSVQARAVLEFIG